MFNEYMFDKFLVDSLEQTFDSEELALSDITIDDLLFNSDIYIHRFRYPLVEDFVYQLLKEWCSSSEQTKRGNLYHAWARCLGTLFTIQQKQTLQNVSRCC